MTGGKLRFVNCCAEFLPKDYIEMMPKGIRGIYALLKLKTALAQKVRRSLHRHGTSRSRGRQSQIAQAQAKQTKGTAVDSLLRVLSVAQYSGFSSCRAGRNVKAHLSTRHASEQASSAKDVWPSAQDTQK